MNIPINHDYNISYGYVILTQYGGNAAQDSVNQSCVTVPSHWKLKHAQPPHWNDFYIIDTAPSIFVDFNSRNDAENYMAF